MRIICCLIVLLTGCGSMAKPAPCEADADAVDMALSGPVEHPDKAHAVDLQPPPAPTGQPGDSCNEDAGDANNCVLPDGGYPPSARVAAHCDTMGVCCQYYYMPKPDGGGASETCLDCGQGWHCF